MSADGRTLYTASHDTRVIAWDLAGDRRLDRPFDPGPPFALDDPSPRGFAISPDGRRLAVTQADGTVNLLDTRTLAPRGRFHALDGYAAAVEFSPDGRMLAVTGERGRVTLWDARTLRAAGELRGLPVDNAQALAFSPNGRLLAGATNDGIKRGGDAGVGHALPQADARALPTSWPRRWPSRPMAGCWRPPGRPAPPRSATPAAAAWSPACGPPTRAAPSRSPPTARCLPRGSTTARSSSGPPGTGNPPSRALEGHSGRVTAVEFAPGGRTLLSAGEDGTLQLWDVASRKPVGSPQPVEPNSYVAAVFAPDSKRVFAVSAGTAGLRWEISPEAWKQHACAVAGRELSAREWSDALPGRPSPGGLPRG